MSKNYQDIVNLMLEGKELHFTIWNGTQYSINWVNVRFDSAQKALDKLSEMGITVEIKHNGLTGSHKVKGSGLKHD